jgi:cyclase
VVLNTGALDVPQLIDDAAREHGSQAVVICMDVRRGTGGAEVLADGGRRGTGLAPAVWARQAVDRGAGEILVQSIDRDGRGNGYDLDLIHDVARSVDVPVIALGGVGQWQHFIDGLEAGASAVAAANIFNYTENSVYKAKRHLVDGGLPFRSPRLGYSLDAAAA